MAAGLVVGVLAACRPAPKAEADAAKAVPTKPESDAAVVANGMAPAFPGTASESAAALPVALSPKSGSAEGAKVATGAGGVAESPAASQRPSHADWAKLARAQLLRPTDFAKLTAELKRKQALASGLDESAVRAELEKRALAGDAEAALTLGLLLRYDDSANGKAQGEKLITAAAESGNARAMAELGRIMLADEKRADGPSQAEAWLRKSWAAGESEGAYLLASAQRLGLLEPARGEDPIALLLAAAESGNGDSQWLLTLLRNEINGLDQAQLDEWMTAIADSGNVAAMLQLASLKRESGQYATAITWLERAAASGSTDAIMMLAMLAGSGETGAEARASAITHLRTQLVVPATASPQAKYALAKLLVLETDHVPEKQAEALGLLREAGQAGIYQAGIAAMMIEGGTGPHSAFLTVLKMDDAAAYVRYVELCQAKGDTTYSAFADAMPKPLATLSPNYPVELKAAGTTGEVTVRFMVRVDGTVASCEVLQSDHPALSAAAVEAVQQWRFRPGIKDGKPVAIQVQITVPFRLAN